MSDFAKRAARARRKSMRHWSRGLRYAGEVGAILTGAAAWIVLVVVVMA